MRDIEGIELVVDRLKRHWADIDAHFAEENGKFIRLFSQPHDVLGRLLKCHLIIEHYLERFLSEHYGIDDIATARLGFYNKASLIPSAASSAAFVKPGIMRLNKLRNMAGHQLGAEFSFEDLGAINKILDVARTNVRFEAPIDAIEAFTTIACTWLIVPPPHLQQLFSEAFAEVRVAHPT
jgi:hypothetical protein